MIFVHRTDKGGQFLSYRQLRQWLNAIACHIQNCSSGQQLRQLWSEIEADRTQHHKQYDSKSHPFLSKMYSQQETFVKRLSNFE